MPKEITLENIRNLSTKSIEQILEIRNSEDVRKWMYRDTVISKEEHGVWVGNLCQSSSVIAFAVCCEGEVYGLVSFNKMCKNNLTADWAYYLSDKARGGLGAALEYVVIDYFFGELEMEKLNCEVIEGNEAVVKLHKKFHFEQEGFRKSNIIKNGVRVGVYFMGLEKAVWEANKNALARRYEKIFNLFNFRFKS